MNLKYLPLRKIAIGVIAFILLIVGISSFYTVDEGQRGIVLRSGGVIAVKHPGLNIKLPFFDKVIIVDVRTRAVEVKINGASKDLQVVSNAIVVNYHFDDKKLVHIYGKTGLDIEATIIRPRIDETVTSIISDYDATDLILKREVVKEEVDRSLRYALAGYNVVVENVMITSFDFSPEYAKAIERKTVALQDALTAKNKLETAKANADIKITEAKAEAESIRIQSESLKANGGELMIQKNAIDKWDGKLPTYMTGTNTPFIKLK